MERRRVFEIVPIQQVDVYTAVLDQLGKLIKEGGYQRGDRLPGERSLAESLGVSRMVVREALKVLASMGKVEIVHGSGTFVVNPTQDALTAQFLPALGALDDGSLRNLIDVRVALEVKVVELATVRATEPDLIMLREVIERLEHEHLTDAEIGSLNVSFEAAVAQAAHNPLLAALQASVHQLWIEAWGRRGQAPGSKRALHREHERVLQAIERRDVRAATRIMRQHVGRLLPDVGPRDAGEEPSTTLPADG